MSDSPQHNGDGATSSPERQPDCTRSLAEHRREIQHDAEALAVAVQEAADSAQHYLTEQVARRPYRTLGVAAGIGYVLGGGLSSRLTTLVFGAATRLAMALAARELGVRLLQDSSRKSWKRDPLTRIGGAKELS